VAERTDAQILAEIASDKGIAQTTFIRCQLEVQLDIRRHHQEQVALQQSILLALNESVEIQKKALEIEEKILDVIQKGK